MADGFERFFSGVVRHRVSVLTFAVACTAVAAVGASRVRVDYGVEQFLPSRGPSRETYDEYKLHFSEEDTRFSLFWSDERAIGVELYLDLQRAAAAFEDVGLHDVQWLGTLPMLSGRDLTDEHIREVLARHRDDPLLRGTVWDEEQRVFAVHGHIDPDLNTDGERRRVEQALTEKLDALGINGSRLVLSGIPVLRSRIPKLLERDQSLFLGGGSILFFGILWFFLRSIPQVVLCLASVLPAYICTMGLMGVMGRPVTIMTSFMPIVVLVVGVSDSIHLLAGFRRERGRGLTNRDAVTRSFGTLARSCLFTSATTAVGFASLAGTGIGLISEFGLFTALAIMLTFVVSMTVLPALLSFLPTTSFNDSGLLVRWIRGILAAAVSAAGQRPRRAAVAFSAAAIAGLALGSGLRINTFLVDDLKETSQVMADLRWIESNGFGLFQANVYLRDAGPFELHSPPMLDWMRELQGFASSDPLVLGTMALPDFLAIPSVDGSGADARRLPRTTVEASRALEIGRRIDPAFATEVYRQDAGVAQVVFTLKDEGSARTIPFLDDLERYLALNPPPAGAATATGLVMLVQTYTSQVLRSFAPGIALAIVLIFGLMSWLFRSIRMGLLALLPNAFPLIVLAGVMRVTGIDLKPSTVLVFSIAFAIAVDDTIHFLTSFRRSLRGGRTLSEALERSIQSAGPAILVTTVVVSAGFSLLMLSRFEVLFLVGFLTIVSSVTAVVADLFLFPVIVRASWDRLGIQPAQAVDPRHGRGRVQIADRSPPSRHSNAHRSSVMAD